MRSRLLMLLAATFALGAAIAVRADDATLSPTPIQKDGLSIQLPKDWKVQKMDSSRILLAATAPTLDSDTTGDYQASLTISSDTGSDIDGDAQQARLARVIANYEITDKPQHLSINGIDAVRFGGTFTVGSLKLRSEQYLLTKHNTIYTLTVTALASHWDPVDTVTRASVLTFIPPSSPAAPR